jgi:hypothetical protein
MLAHLRAMENFDRRTDDKSVKHSDAPLPEAIRFQLIIALFGPALKHHSNA